MKQAITLRSKVDASAFWEDVARVAIEYVSLGLGEGQFGVPYDMAPQDEDARYLAEYLSDHLERWVQDA